jgi:NAD dependent epimerase/dehydratase family enzyme
MPWIALADAVGATRFLMQIDVRGPVNAVAPESVTNAQFSEELAHVLGRGTFLPVPRFALRAALGSEMANEMLLSGANVRPRRLEIAGYRFEYPRLEDALDGMFR